MNCPKPEPPPLSFVNRGATPSIWTPSDPHLLGPEHHRDEDLRLGCLCGLVDENVLEAEVLQPWVPGTHTGGADDIRMLKDLPLKTPVKEYK